MTRVAKILHRSRIATALAVVAAVLGVGSVSVARAADDAATMAMYTVSGVPVDATGKNAVEAREKALAQGQQEALKRLLTRLTPPEAHATLPMPAASDIPNMVLGVAVDKEKTSAVRYLAELTVSFFPESVRGLLDRSGIAYSDTPAQSLVVVPLFRAAPSATSVLWEDPNPWRAAWANRSVVSGAVPLTIPLGDISDVSAIDATKATAQDQTALGIIAQRYAASGALLLLAEPISPPDPSKGPGVKVSALRTGNTPEAFTVSVDPAPSATLESALRQAVVAVSSHLEGGWKQQAVALGGGSGTMTAVVVLNRGLQDWMTARKVLETSPYVRSWVLRALTRDRAQVEINHAGGDTQFAGAMVPSGLAIVQEAGVWTIRLSSVPVATDPNAGQQFAPAASSGPAPTLVLP